jgi:hypothetical protein
MLIEVARWNIFNSAGCSAGHVLELQAEIADAIAKICRPRLYKEVLCIGCCCCPRI